MEQIVVYTDELKDGVFAFTAECFVEIGKAFEPDGRHSFYNDIENNFDRFWCLVSDGRVLGTAGIRKEDDDCAELKAMYLSKDLRGKGYGYKRIERYNDNVKADVFMEYVF